MTLFSVGFRIEAKAATLSFRIVDKDDHKSVLDDDDWSKGELAGLFTVDPSTDAPAPGESKVYSFTSGYITLKTVTLKLTQDDDLEVYIGESTEPHTPSEGPFDLGTLTAKQVRDEVCDGDDDAPEKTKTFTATATGEEAEINELSVSAYRLSASSDVGAITLSDTYLLPGMSSTVNVEKNPETTTRRSEKLHKFNRWTASTSLRMPEDPSKEEITVTMKLGDDANPAELKANYDEVTVYFNPEIPPASGKEELAPGDSSDKNRSITFDPNEAYTQAKSVKLEDFEIQKEKYKWENGKFYFTVPDIESGEKTLEIELEDGNKIQRTVTVINKKQDGHKITMDVDPRGGGTARAYKADGGEEALYAEEGESISIVAKPDSDSDYEFKEWEVNSGDVELQINEDDHEIAYFTMGTENVKITAHFKYNGDDPEPEIKVDDPIMVTEGTSVRLSHFTDDISEITSIEGDGNYIDESIDKSGSDYIIRGKKSSSGNKVKAITINDKEYSVIVYDRPEITKRTSKDAVLEIKMPTSACNDGTHPKTKEEYYFNWDNIKRTKIGFFRESGSGIGNDYSLSNSGKYGTAKLSWNDINKGLKELNAEYSISDEETVRVYSYPMDPDGSLYDPQVYDRENLDVYKIKLYTSGGAKYKVNDEEMEGSDPWFFAVDGVEYKIEASARNGGSLKYWEVDGSRVDSTSETRTFTADEATTFKAVYNSSSSSSSSSSSYSYYSSSSTGRTTAIGAGGTGSGGDYDDVPRTGESKTDIWILWSVLLASILGAGFMIYKRFGLVRAIAEADKEVAEAAKKESVMKQEKEKENILKTLKGLRKL